MATIGNAPVFPTESVLPGNLQVTGNATISGTTNSVGALTENSNAVRTVATSGAILQVVHASSTTNTSTTSSTYTDTAITANITPTSSSNKIMVHIVANVGWSGSSANSWAGGIRILRDSTVIDTPNNDNGPISFYTGIFGVSGLSTGISRAMFPFFAFDSPATTSSVTYKAQVASRGSANTEVNVTGNTDPGTSYITLMEIVA